MFRLLVQHVRITRGKPRLGIVHNEAVGKAVDVHAVERPHTLRPGLCQLPAFTTNQLQISPARKVSAYLKTGSENKAVQFVLLFPDGNPRRRDTVHALAAGIDQGHIGAIEGLQVLVMKTGPLAELAIIGLQRLRRFGGR